MIYYSAFIVVFQFGWAGVQISHLSLITDLTGEEDTRTLLTSVRYSFTVISNLLVYFTTWIFFGVGEEGQQVDREDSDKFRYGVTTRAVNGLSLNSKCMEVWPFVALTIKNLLRHYANGRL